MSFPKQTPEIVAKAGTLIAQFRSDDTHLAKVLRAHADSHVYLVVDAEGNLILCSSKRQVSSGEFFDWEKRHCLKDSIFATTLICSIVDAWQEACHGVQGIIWNYTQEGKEFVLRLLDARPILKPFVQIRQRKPSAPAKPKPAPRRPILPRSDWMALHYPQHVA